MPNKASRRKFLAGAGAASAALAIGPVFADSVELAAVAAYGMAGAVLSGARSR